MRLYIEYLKKKYHGTSRLCLHNITGNTIAPKICLLNYECSHCAFDQWLDNLERLEINREKSVLRDVLPKAA
ncbi:MAG: hypothetical protein JRF60_04030 [Deltaproteobacteria bacterium]|nr:hypothetical protein [Deltaproteobacteria bacterium]MBW2249807.1 hypothetical protein [Deltaproteobacteria bacterium]MBW2563614.1 hypothetical protein [Deltaproteobacteria bacterium]